MESISRAIPAWAAARAIDDERFWRYLVNRRRVKRTTANDYMRHLRYIGEHFATHPLELDADEVEHYLEQPMSWSRKNLTLVALRHLHGWAARRQLPHDPEIKELRPGRRNQALTQPLSLNEVHRALQAARTTTAQRILLLGLYQGLRRAEIMDLGRDDWILGLDGVHTLRVTGKGDRVRHIPVHTSVMAGREIIEQGWAAKGKMQKTIRRLAEQTGLEQLTIRSLRRTYSETMHRRHGIERPVIGALLGHSPAGVTTTHYVPPRPRELVTAQRVLDYGIDPLITWGQGVRQMRLFEGESW